MYLKRTLSALLFCLVMVPSGLAQSFQYADDCFTSVDNATTIVPSNVDPSLPNGSTLASADTIAIEDSGGNCIGYGVWADNGDGLVIAAAGSTAVTDTTSGLSPDASLSWEVYDASTESVVELGSDVLYASCDTISVPTCQDDGQYADGSVFVLTGMQKSPYVRSVSGEDGTGNDAGWRMLSLPAAEATRSALEDDLDFQTSSGSLMYRWANGQWVAQTSSSDALPRGSGFLLYFFDDSTDPVDADGLPLDVNRGPENPHSDKQIDELSRNEEWALLGNPFPVAYDLGALAGGDLEGAGFQATVQVWNPETGQYEQMVQGNSGDEIPAWQGFFVQRSTVGEGQTSLTFGSSGRAAESGALIGNKQLMMGAKEVRSKMGESSTEVALRLELTGSDGNRLSTDLATYWVDQRASLGYDGYEAEDLSPVSGGGYATATLPATKDGQLVHRAFGAAPPPEDNDSFERSIPLSVRGVGASGTATLTWPEDREQLVPADWSVQLTDTQVDSTINLRDQNYEFALEAGDSLATPDGARFRLVLQSGTEALPVDLSQFEGTVATERVTLRWKTASEQNNAGFHVERRLGDQNREWTTVGFVEGTGTTAKPQRYQFKDADLPYAADTLRYRLRQVDTDGTTTSSDAITVARGSVESLELLGTFPNPARSYATVQYAIPERKQKNDGIQLALYDLMGRQVRVLKEEAEAGRHERRLSVTDLASGVYFLRLQYGGSVQTRKVTVVH